MGAALKEFNTIDGTTNYGGNKLWKLLTADLSNEEFEQWTSFLRKISKEDAVEIRKKIRNKLYRSKAHLREQIGGRK